MKKHKVTFIPGDGTGPEIMETVRKCVDATGVSIEWETVHAGTDVFEKTGNPLPDELIESVKRNRVAIKGPITTPVGKGFRSVNVALRHALDLYACLRPCKWYPGVKSPYKNIDLVIVRENSEDLYAGIEFFENTPEAKELITFLKTKTQSKALRDSSAISIKPISEFASSRIVRFAFEYALQNGRRKVTAVHKANIMKATDGLFLRSAQKVAKEYEGKILFEDRIVDNMCMQLVQKPQEYDVLVLPNLYGDVLSDLCAGLIGGLGVAPGANIGDKAAVFEATHGSAPKYKGLNKVNPTACILSGVLMLRHLKEDRAASALEKAVEAVILEGKSVTYDLKPFPKDPNAVGTREMGEAIVKSLRRPA